VQGNSLDHCPKIAAIDEGGLKKTAFYSRGYSRIEKDGLNPRELLGFAVDNNQGTMLKKIS